MIKRPSKHPPPLSRRELILAGIAAGIGSLAITATPSYGQANTLIVRQLKLATSWLPQAQFAGYYMAQHKGFYQAQNIDVIIDHCGPGRSALSALMSGDVDFATLWFVTAITNQQSGAQLINLAQTIQNSSLLLLWRRSAIINSPRDLHGRRVSLWGGDHQIPYDILLKDVAIETVPQGSTANLFIRNLVSACAATWYNEYYQIMNSTFVSEDFHPFFLSSANINLPEDGLYTLPSRIRSDPALVHAFVNASLEGWRYAFENVDETVEIVLKIMRKSKLVSHRPHQKWMLERIRDLSGFSQNSNQFGTLSRDRFSEALALLKSRRIDIPPIIYDQFVRSSHV